MSYTERFTEMHYPLIKVNPAVKSAGAEVISSYVSLANYHRAVLLIQTGTITATGTIIVRLLQATDTSGTSAKGIPTTATQDKITTTLTTADANSVIAIELRTEELDVTNGFDCVAVGYDVDTDNVTVGMVLWGIEPVYAPVSAAGYNEVVA